MIVKNLKNRKKRSSIMGQIISKEKKQKREALLPQMKSKAEAAPVSPAKKPPSPSSPSSSSPPPPPRSLAATLASAALSAEFLAYLQKLDTAAGGGADREHTLQFVIKVRALKKEEDPSKKVTLLKQIGESFFSPESGLVLDNTELWRRCADTCAACSEDPRAAEGNVARAHDSVLAELEELHLLFVQQRRDTSCVDKILCIL